MKPVAFGSPGCCWTTCCSAYATLIHLAAWLLLLAFCAILRLFSVKRLLVVILSYLALLVAWGPAQWHP